MRNKINLDNHYHFQIIIKYEPHDYNTD